MRLKMVCDDNKIDYCNGRIGLLYSVQACGAAAAAAGSAAYVIMGRGQDNELARPAVSLCLFDGSV